MTETASLEAGSTRDTGVHPLALLQRDDVREWLQDGRAVVLVDEELENVGWASPAAIHLLGATSLEALRDEVPSAGRMILRQAHSAARRVSMRGGRAEGVVRTRTDFRTRLLKFEASDGENGVLLGIDVEGEGGDAGLAAAALAAADASQEAALLDADGAPVEASDGFAALGIGSAVLLAARADESDEVEGENGRHHVRFADLDDEPQRTLALVDREPLPRPEPEAGHETVGVAAPVAAAAVVATAPSRNRRWYYRGRNRESEPTNEADVESGAEAEIERTIETVDQTFEDHAASFGEGGPAATDPSDDAETTESIDVPVEANTSAEPVAADDTDPEPKDDGPSRPVGFLARAATGVAATALGAAGLVRTVRQSDDGNEDAPTDEQVEDVDLPEPNPKQDDERREDHPAPDGAADADPAAEVDAGDGFVGAALYSAPPDGFGDMARKVREFASDEPTEDDAAPVPIEAPSDPSRRRTDRDQADAEPSGFTFRRSERATRFVWSVDADQRFTSVSEPLAQTVGDQAAAIEGERWSDVADRLQLDEGGAIADLLSRGDTWSGRTVLWPVDGEALRVPVDLAGLPAFDRDRNFVGFNGFGIVRTADAVPDTHERREPPASSEDEGDTDETASVFGLADVSSRPTLSDDDRATFERIGETLDSSTRDADPIDGDANEDEGTDPLAFETPEPAELIEELVDDETDPGTEGADPGTEGADPGTEEAEDYASGSRIRVAEVRDVDTSILTRLPIPVLAYRADVLLFANTEFFRLTGYDDLHTLADAGGVEALFGGEHDAENLAGADVLHRDGHRLAVEPHLQTVPWDHERAMLLTLKRDDDGSPKGPRGDRPSDDDAPKPGPSPITTGRKSRARLTRVRRALGTGGGTASEGDASDEDGPRPAASSQGRTFADLSPAALNDILDTATEGVLILDAGGRVRALNRSAEALFGIDAPDIVGEPFLRLLAPESHRTAQDYLASLAGPGAAPLLNDGREVIGRVGADTGPSTGGDGLLPLTLTVGRIEDGADEPLLCAVLRDMTQWKRTEEDLLNARAAAESANRMKSDFLTTVSHEVRNPLNAIIGFAEMMTQERFGPLGSDRYLGYARDIRRSGRHALDIVNDLLDISKIEAGEMRLDFTSVSLNTVVTETVAMSQPEANRERIVIRTSLAADLPLVTADERSMRQIVLNLLSNALRYTEAGGQVIVSTASDGEDGVALRVRDTGVGMNEAEIEQALTPFRQVQGEHAGKRGGTGLGLPLTKAMIEANRARFTLKSVPQEGTMVEMRFAAERVSAH